MWTTQISLEAHYWSQLVRLVEAWAPAPVVVAIYIPNPRDSEKARRSRTLLDEWIEELPHEIRPALCVSLVYPTTVSAATDTKSKTTTPPEPKSG